MMKPITLYLALTLAAVLGAANAAPVLDTAGHPLLVNRTYYVIPPLLKATNGDESQGGGLKLAGRVSWLPCPPDVIQSPVYSDNGFPVRFFGPPGSNIVLESENLHINFLAPLGNLCPQRPFYWWLDVEHPEWGQYFVTTKNHVDSYYSMFKIEKLKDGYKFVFSPRGDYNTDIGVFTTPDGILRLAKSTTPLNVMFMKATQPDDFMSIISS